jgi:hypothetical protein
MLLNGELRKIHDSKEVLVKRGDMRRMTFMLDILATRARVRGAVSGLQAGLAVAELIRSLVSGRKGRDC